MLVRLRASGHAREYLPGGGEEQLVELPGPKPVRAILTGLGVKTELVMAVFIDGRRASLDDTPGDGSEVLLVSPPAGG